MTLILSDADVRAAVDMATLVDAIERATKEEGRGQVVQPERMNLPNGEGVFRVMPVVLSESGVMGFKVFHGSPRGSWRYLVAVYDAHEGSLLALMDAHFLTALRTGAATGVATRLLARQKAHRVGVIGSGLEARTNLEAVCVVRPVDRVRVFSPNAQKRQRFAAEMAERLQVEIEAVDSPEEAVGGTDIVVVATNTTGHEAHIAYRGSWIEPGQHVNAIGSTMLGLREIDEETFRRVDLLVTDAPAEQIERESGDVAAALAANTYDRSRVVRLCELLTGQAEGRARDDQMTLYKSVGEALQDVIAGYAIYQTARARGIGTEVGDFLLPKAFG
ncbi:MAG: ornithine cyclodeaminase family protein [Firmicutes bacterium]|nr:ornithine cyclodeaminase family protein [Bacillota bacterium]